MRSVRAVLAERSAEQVALPPRSRAVRSRASRRRPSGAVRAACAFGRAGGRAGATRPERWSAKQTVTGSASAAPAANGAHVPMRSASSPASTGPTSSPVPPARWRRPWRPRAARARRRHHAGVQMIPLAMPISVRPASSAGGCLRARGRSSRARRSRRRDDERARAHAVGEAAERQRDDDHRERRCREQQRGSSDESPCWRGEGRQQRHDGDVPDDGDEDHRVQGEQAGGCAVALHAPQTGARSAMRPTRVLVTLVMKSLIDCSASRSATSRRSTRSSRRARSRARRSSSATRSRRSACRSPRSSARPGTRLLERPGGRRPVVPTDAGERMLRHAARLTAQLQAAEADLTALAEGTAETLRVGRSRASRSACCPMP